MRNTVPVFERNDCGSRSLKSFSSVLPRISRRQGVERRVDEYFTDEKNRQNHGENLLFRGRPLCQSWRHRDYE